MRPIRETILVVAKSGGSNVGVGDLGGTVERITFRNEENLYTVARFAVKGTEAAHHRCRQICVYSPWGEF